MQTETVGHIPPETHAVSADRSALLAKLDMACRRRREIIRARTRLSNQIDAKERTITGKLKSKKAAKNRFVVSPEARKAAEDILPTLSHYIEPMKADQRALDKYVEALAKQLPVWPWVEGIRGVGPLAFGTVIGETGDLSNYGNPAKVWKRLGLAPYDGKACSTWRKVGKLKAEEWEALGYVPRRRSVVYLLGWTLKMQNKGEYRRIYEERKAYEIARLPEDVKGRKGWAENRAIRYMTKRFILHLWLEWNNSVR